MRVGIRWIREGVDKATDEARWFKIVEMDGPEVRGAAVFGYRGYELSITTVTAHRWDSQGAVFKCRPNPADWSGGYVFAFDATPEGIAEACRKIDAIIAGDAK